MRNFAQYELHTPLSDPRRTKSREYYFTSIFIMFLKETLQKCLNFVTSDLVKASLMPTVNPSRSEYLSDSQSGYPGDPSS